MVLETLSGPIIGAVIGYFTNYIAVKMLFYPRKEVRICGRKLPFTPGAIPKGKPRLAKAVGNAVANTLLTEEDIKQRILSAETEEAIVNGIMDSLACPLYEGIQLICSTDEEYTSLKANLSNALTDQIMDSVGNIDLENTIVTEAERVVREKISGTMIAMFLSGEMLHSLIQPVGAELEKYIMENGAPFVRAEIDEKITSLEQKSIQDLCSDMNLGEEIVRSMIRSAYQKLSEKAAGVIIKNISISGMIEEKINEMPVEELEKLVLTVMKKELDTIVNLGALVGGILGVLNIFI